MNRRNIKPLLHLSYIKDLISLAFALNRPDIVIELFLLTTINEQSNTFDYALSLYLMGEDKFAISSGLSVKQLPTIEEVLAWNKDEQRVFYSKIVNLGHLVATALPILKAAVVQNQFIGKLQDYINNFHIDEYQCLRHLEDYLTNKTSYDTSDGAQHAILSSDLSFDQKITHLTHWTGPRFFSKTKDIQQVGTVNLVPSNGVS